MRKVVPYLLVLFSLAARPQAQPGAATLSGTVFDPMGWAVPKVSLLLSQAGSEVKRGRTDEAGRYAFSGLRDGEYVLEAKRDGFEVLRAPVSVTAQGATGDLRLTLGSAREELTVFVTSWTAKPSPDRVRSVSKGAAPQCSRESIARRQGGQIRVPRKTLHAPLDYPPEALATKVQGRSLVRGAISATGAMRDVVVVESTLPMFGAATLESVRRWEFDPTYLNCTPVEVTLEVIVNYVKQ